ncbi:uncharacterized protein LOC101854136 [Aplysia californica]|uniref:Uncharacterized protein LOC101854136 n=1 Tax=Aplysia californica TaxID=6500 RepID=A0ABM0KA74_APLCA|nr:uncharacterized protein LOC101854136 [Aplysia californica]XP_005112650.1 uncharacterized protein LOC101854136 [Aplysia californica]
MEKSDNPALSVAEENNLLLRLIVAQLVSINNRLDTLETHINRLLQQCQLVTSATTASCGLTLAEDQPIQDECQLSQGEGQLGQGEVQPSQGEGQENSSSVIASIPNDIDSLITAKVESMRQEVLERVGQAMQDSMLRTSSVIEKSMTHISEEIRKTLDTSITTLAVEVDKLKQGMEDVNRRVQSFSPPARESDIRNTMEKLSQTLTAANKKSEAEVTEVRDAQAELSEEIRQLKLDIRQLQRQRSSQTGSETQE